jgi:hypothetical protein
MSKSKKQPMVTNVTMAWGEENQVSAGVEELTAVTVTDDEGEEVVRIEPDGDTGLTVTVGPTVIAVRRPTGAEKRQGWERVIEAQSGFDDENVLLGDESGVAVLTDEYSDEAE